MAKIYSRGQNQAAREPLSGSQPNPLERVFGPPDDLRQKASTQLEELVAALGAARAFSNNPDAKKLLVKIQHKLLNIRFILENHISPTDPTALMAISPMDVAGLTNCIQIFGIELPLSLKKIIPGANKAGSQMRLAALAAQHISETMQKITEHDQSFATISAFLKTLTTLLTTLERTEYKIANLEEEYWN